jgi:hypothetical protein
MHPEDFKNGIGEDIPLTQPEHDLITIDDAKIKKKKKRAPLTSVHPSSYLTPKKTGRAKKKPKVPPPAAPPRNRVNPEKLSPREISELQMRDTAILSELTDQSEVSIDGDVVDLVVDKLMNLEGDIGPLRAEKDEDEVEFVKVENTVKEDEVECILVINANKN